MAIAIIALENDLFFSVRIRDTLSQHAMAVTIARNLAKFEQAVAAADPALPTVAMVDISLANVDWEAAIRAARAQNLPVLTFGSHKDLAARARALQAGAQKVIANSKLVQDMPGVVKRMLDAPETLTTAEDAEDDE